MAETIGRTINLTSAGRGAAGTTAMEAARRAQLRYEFTTREISGDTAAAKVACTYMRCVLAVETVSMDDEETHIDAIVASSNEIVKLTYTTSTGSRIRTCDPVKAIGIGPSQFPHREEGATTSPPNELLFLVLEGSGTGHMKGAITDAAAGG